MGGRSVFGPIPHLPSLHWAGLTLRKVAKTIGYWYVIIYSFIHHPLIYAAFSVE